MKLLIWSLCLLTIPVRAEVPTQETVESQLKAFIRAPYLNDKNTFFEYLTEQELKYRGGEKGVKIYLDQKKEAVQRAGMTMSDLVIKKPYSHEVSKLHDFFLVEVSLTNTAYQKKYKNTLIYLAVKKKGQNQWKYVNASRFGKKKIKSFYYYLPENILAKIPKKKP